jgi:tetratricopeptide (TPR) repeat protein
MTTTDSRPQRFPSMDALRQANEHLFDTIPESDQKLSPEDREANAKLIETFIDRAIATGTILDTLPDRREAQALIDYWVTNPSIKAHSRAETLKSSQPTRSDNQLERFDAKVIEAAAASGDQFIKTLAPKEQDLVKQILLSLIKIPENGGEFQSAPATRDSLQKIGARAHVDKLLEGMQHADVLRPIEGGSSFALSYLALTRRWQWLANELKTRMNLRDLALGWVNSGRRSGALLDYNLTRQFRRYSNLAPWETDFINRSGRYTWIKVGVVAVALAMILLGPCWRLETALFEKWYVEPEGEFLNNDMRIRTTPMTSRIADLKWLSEYRQSVNGPNIVLTGPGAELNGLSAPGAVFDNSRLSGVQFKGAMLENASLIGSVIRASNFEDARFSRAKFDMVDFCADVDFSGADIVGASFRRSAFLDQGVPKFQGAAWWMAYGWDFDQIDQLARLYPTRFPNDKLQEQLARLSVRISDATVPLDQALLLNQKAWTLVVEGAVADGEARKAIEQALTLVDKAGGSGPPPNVVRMYKAEFQDTLAYVLLQESETQADPAKKQTIDRAVAHLSDASQVSNEAEVWFRYAVALHAAGQTAEASTELDKALQTYEPSHELYLLRAYITGDFKQRIIRLTGRLNQRRLPTRCPPGDRNTAPQSSAGATGRAAGERN